MLEQQKIDLGLVAEPRTSKGLVFLPVMDIEDIFAASPSYLENFRLREGDQADVFQSGNVMLLDLSLIHICIHEMKLIVDLIYQSGFAGMRCV